MNTKEPYKIINRQTILERMTLLQGNRYFDANGKEIPKYQIAWSKVNIFELLKGNRSIKPQKRERPQLDGSKNEKTHLQKIKTKIIT